MTIEEEIEFRELKRRVEELEKRPVYIPYSPPAVFPQQPQTWMRPPFHYHGTQPCYNNPCVWN